MKKLLFTLCAICVFCSCVRNTDTGQDSATVATNDGQNTPVGSKFMFANIVDSILSANPDCLDNDIKRKRVAQQIQATLIDTINKNHDILTQIPLKYKMMLQRGNVYLVKFELTTLDTRISDKYDIYFNVFSELSEDEASELVQDKTYYLDFKSVSDANNNLVLPSGNTIDDVPVIYNSSGDTKMSVSAGSFLLKDLKF